MPCRRALSILRVPGLDDFSVGYAGRQGAAVDDLRFPFSLVVTRLWVTWLLRSALSDDEIDRAAGWDHSVCARVGLHDGVGGLVRSLLGNASDLQSALGENQFCRV